MRAVVVRLIPAQLRKQFAYILRARSARKIAYAVGHVLPFLSALVSTPYSLQVRYVIFCGPSVNLSQSLFGAHWHL
jgi:hypothetical protein